MSASRARAADAGHFWWQLRIELLEVTPRVWRSVLVPETITLPVLHRVLQTCMGWTDSHLHEFTIKGVRYAQHDPEWAEDLKQVDERRVVLNRVLEQSRCFDYLYDFGDDWHHVVLLEDPHAGHSKEGLSLKCLAGENACPPEDVGGAHGYGEFLAAIADPANEQHENYLSWAGGRFDPARIDLAAINRALKKIKI